MRLLQINTAAGRGVAGGIPEAIGSMAAARGIDARMAVGRPNGRSASQLLRIGSRADILTHVAATRIADRHGLHSRAATRRFVRVAEELCPDVVHLHNIHGYYLHLPTLFDWLRGSGVPVVWTLHDCWPLTGHCAFFNAAGCTRWQQECHHCPLLRDYPASLLLDRSRQNHALKRRLFTSLPDLTLVCVGSWLDSIVAQSYLRDVPRTVIPNGVDTDVFAPCAPKAPADSPLLLGVAAHWEARKGLDTFVRLRRELPAHWRMRLVGLDSRRLRSLPPGIEGLGRIDSERALAAHYSEATVFVNPSSAECNNITKMEALACGTPVVAYDAGGAGEGIGPEAGRVCRAGCFDDLCSAIAESAQGRLRPEACRDTALRLFDMRRNLEAYFTLYASLL